VAVKFEEENLFQKYENEIIDFFDFGEIYFYSTYIAQDLFEDENQEYFDLLDNIKNNKSDYKKYHERILKCREFDISKEKIYLSDLEWRKEVGLAGITKVEENEEQVQKVDYFVLEIKREIERAFKVVEKDGFAATEDIFNLLSDETKRYFKNSIVALGKKIPTMMVGWKSERKQVEKRKCAGWRQD